MAIVDLLMPKMGESIMEATILKWNKKPGDSVEQDESLLEIATDKVDSEVPSMAGGILKEILFPENAVVPVGTIIARIETEVNAAAAPGALHQSPDLGQPAADEKQISEEPHIERWSPEFANTSFEKPDNISSPAVNREWATANSQQAVNGNRFYSPLVLNIASNEGIGLAELEKIPGSGNEGRVTKKDILHYVAKRKDGNGYHSHPPDRETTFAYSDEPARVVAGEDKNRQAESIPLKVTGNVEIQEMDRMRKLIAEHMVRSKHTSPHVTSFSEADVTNLVLWREKEKTEFETREGTKLTLTPLFIEAIIKCIKKYPLINSSLQGDKIIIRKDINIGMATALPSGSLIVPVIKNADNYNRVGLARQVNTLANNARNNKLKPEDIQEGTFTLTNVGVFGSLMGTPIINQPQVAILAVGAIKKRPVVIETEQGDSIGIRHMMYLSMSYDHRIIDGSLGATFLTAVANELERFQA
jgi:2-oxoglutarate dehydrogenase E2 component (dihydrolipoamide succinyltransferase)